MLEFPKALFLVLHFSYYTLMTFLTMFSLMLLSMLMIVLSILSVIRHLICSNNVNWFLNLNLIYKTLWTEVRCGLMISLLGKWMGEFLRKNHILRCWGWPSLLNWIGNFTSSLLLKLPPRKLEL